MKTFKNVCAQGDVYITRIKELPKNAIPADDISGKYVIITHSETGHHHVMEKEKVKTYKLPDSVMDLLLVVEDPVKLEHLREFDTHEPILFTEGVYHIRRQREHTPEGFRQVQD